MQDRLRERREADGLTQAALAERWGISSNYYSRIERGTVLPGPKLRRTIESYTAATTAVATAEPLDQIREALQHAARNADERAVLDLYRTSPTFRALADACREALKKGNRPWR